MRTLSGTLKAAQQATSIDALIKLVLTFGASTYTYTRLEILDLTEKEDGPLHSIEITLDNSDGALTSLDLRGYKGVFSSGAHTGAGDEYSACAPMWVKAQRFDSSEGVLTCTLSLVGICNLMMDDKASAKYMPDEEDTKTIKTLIGEIAGATLTGFTHCTAYDIEWDGEDDLIDSYTPKDAFRVYVGNNRFSKITQLLDLTKCVMRAEADGKLHIFVPTTTGEDFDYEYSLESGHSFWAKAYRNRLTIPNRIYVMSREDDDPAYQGMAYEADSYDKLPKVEFHQTYLESNDQGQDIAEAMLAKAQMWCEAGSANVPMNVGAEVFDYVKVTDSRESDYRVGNIGQIIRHFNLMKNEWRMTFVFGNWQNVRKALAELGITADDLENYFSRLQVGDLYVEHILADNMDFVWIDPDGTIDLSQIGDTLDNLPDGEVYARVKTLHLDAGLIKLDEHILYSSGYNPTDKFDLNNNDLDDVPNGSVYRRVKSAALTAAGLILLDQVVAGTYGPVLTTAISGGKIKLSTAGLDTSQGYGLILTTDIQNGHIKGSAIIQSSLYRLVSDDFMALWDGAADDAEDALELLGNIAADDKVTPVEKLEAKLNWDAIVAEKPKIVAEAQAVGVSTTAYVNAYNALNTYLNTTLDVFDNMDSTTTVTRSTWYSKWETYYTAKVDILNAIADLVFELAADAYDIGVAAEETAEGNLMYGYANFNAYAQDKGEWYNLGGVAINGSSGINIFGTNYALTTRATKTGAIQCYVGSDGKFYAGNGSVQISRSKLRIRGLANLEVLDEYDSVRGGIGASSAEGFYIASNGRNINIVADPSYRVEFYGRGIVLPLKSSAPSSPVDGQVVYDSSDGHIKYYSAHDSQWFRIQRTGGWG